ncbi:MAG TPA: hypothetical protein VJY39_21860 [Acidisphaera sp.]|nr:hypothetical protein [Acidisphaera sp.]
MPLSAPPDRTLARAATVGTLRAHWLETRCCRSVSLPLQVIARQGHAHRTLADVVVRLRCSSCGEPPASIELIEHAAMVGAAMYGGRPPWRVQLVGP